MNYRRLKENEGSNALLYKRTCKPSNFSRHAFADKDEEKKEEEAKDSDNEESESDAKAQLVGMLDPTKCDEDVIEAISESCAIEKEQASEMVEAVQSASEEGASVVEEFSRSAERDRKLHLVDVRFSRRIKSILNTSKRHFADEKENEELAVDGEVLAKDVAILVKAMDSNSFNEKTPEEMATIIESATELPKDTSLALIALRNSPIEVADTEGEDEAVVDLNDLAEDNDSESEEEEETDFARHLRLARARREFAKKKAKASKKKKTAAKEKTVCAKRKAVPSVSLDMRQKVRDAFAKTAKKETKMRNITDNLEEVRAFSRKRHFAEMLRKKRLARAKVFADPDAFEPIVNADPDKPQVAAKSNRPHGHLNSTLAARIRSTAQSEATKARDTQGRISDISAAECGESLAEMNEMAIAPNSRFARHNRMMGRSNNDEFSTLRQLLGDKFRD